MADQAKTKYAHDHVRLLTPKHSTQPLISYFIAHPGQLCSVQRWDLYFPEPALIKVTVSTFFPFLLQIE